MRRADARRLRLAIDPRTAAVRLTLPRRAAVAPALAWAAGKRAWVEAELARLPVAQPIVPGMVFTLGDETVRLDWDAERLRQPRFVSRETAELLNHRLPELVEGLPFFCLPEEERTAPFDCLPSAVAQDRLRQAQGNGVACPGYSLQVGGPLDQLAPRVLRFLRAQAAAILAAESHAFAARHGITLGKVGVGDQRGRWGSCSTSGDIRYSWRLILAPEFVRTATVAHEVAHRLHMDHSRAFHHAHARLLDTDPAPARAWLRAQGAALHWFGCSD